MQNTNELKLIDVGDYSQELAKRQRGYSSSLPKSKLFVRGRAQTKDLAAKPRLAIIGTRHPTSYGRNFVANFIEELKAQKLEWILTSGGAFGIDTEVHMQALKYGFDTQAWVVGPIMSPSPRSHERLFERISQKGGSSCIITPESLELVPNQSHSKPTWLWHQRNQWLMAASDAVIVVEACNRSGTWSSVKMAQRLTIPRFALEGPIFSAQSQGTNAMISGGYAKEVGGIKLLIESLVVELGGNPYNNTKGAIGNYNASRGSSDEHRFHAEVAEFLRQYFRLRPKLELDELSTVSARLGCTVPRLVGVLSRLVQNGEILGLGDGFERG